MIFSDFEQELHGIKVYDVLSRISKSNKEHNPEFELYWRQKALQKVGYEHMIAGLSRINAPFREDFGKGRT